MTLLNTADRLALGSSYADRAYLGADLVWGSPVPSGYSLLDDLVPTDVRNAPYEIGMKFSTSSDGWITGLRYYRGDADSQTSRTLTLWGPTGAILAQTTTHGESGLGWFTADIPDVAIPAGTYSVSWSNTGSYSKRQPQAPFTKGALTFIDGVFQDEDHLGQWPVLLGGGQAYFVDVVFLPVPVPGYIGTSSGNFVQAPDDPRLDVLGDLDIRVLAALDVYGSGSKGYLSRINSYNLTLQGDELRLEWHDGSNWRNGYSDNLKVAAGIADGDWCWVRATLSVNEGGVHVVRFYYSVGFADPTWTLFTTRTGTPTNGRNVTEIITVGTHGGEVLTGKIAAAQVLNGINGTPVVNLDYRHATSGPAQTDSTGNVWTATGTVPFTASTL